LSRNHRVFAQGDVFEQQTHHAFAVSIRCSFIAPDPWKIFYEVRNGLLFQCIQATLFLFLLLLNVLLNVGVFV